MSWPTLDGGSAARAAADVAASSAAPPLLGTEDSQLLDALRSLRWPARRLPPQAGAGGHLSRSLGPAAELSAYRAYRQGEDTRRIDWKLLARTDRTYIRLAQDHSQASTQLLLDASASMAWPPRTLGKWQQARRLALGLAAAAHQSGDPVGVLAAQGRASAEAAPLPSLLHALPPRNRAGTVQQIAVLLARVQPRGRLDLAALLPQCRQQRLVVISDFLDDAAGTERLLAVAGRFCAQGGDVLALHIVDPAELEPPRRLDLLHDSEDPHQLRYLGARARAQYQRDFGQWREQLARQWRGRGAQFATVISDEPAALAVRRIVANLAAGHGGRRA